MPSPIDNLTTNHLDTGTDDPSQARVELLAAINKIKEIISAGPIYNESVTAFARTLMDDANAAAARATLEVPRVAALPAGSDFNTVVDSGFYRFQDLNTNGPGFSYGQLIVSRLSSSDTIAQIAIDYSTGNLRIRAGNPSNVGGAGSWNPWRTYWNDGNDGAGSGLDADLLDGYQLSVLSSPDTVVARSGGIGRINAGVVDVVGSVGLGSAILTCYSLSTGRYSLNVGAADDHSYSASGCVMYVGRRTVTGRSINAAGTLNASGADYAEYERKRDDCGKIAKGDIVGFDADGMLTDRWGLAISFGIKSTNPSYVGGDSWGTTEEALGCKYPHHLPNEPSEPPDRSARQDLRYIDRHAAQCEEYAYAKVEYDVAKEAYDRERADLDEKLEAARQCVDRIAYSGKVPINLLGARPGDYIVPIEDGDGGITGKAVPESDLTFTEYRKAIGRVRKILDDGRPEVAVIVH